MSTNITKTLHVKSERMFQIKKFGFQLMRRQTKQADILKNTVIGPHFIFENYQLSFYRTRSNLTPIRVGLIIAI